MISAYFKSMKLNLSGLRGRNGVEAKLNTQDAFTNVTNVLIIRILIFFKVIFVDE